jgi:hypothetical protein
MTHKYVAVYSIAHVGWCVFRLIDALTMKFHAGAFSERAVADSECMRLNELLNDS